MVGALLDDWWGKEIGKGRKRDEEVERLYGMDGIGLWVGNGGWGRKKRIYWEWKGVGERVGGVMEWSEDDEYLDGRR